MFDRVRKIGMAVAALGALALGGSAIAGAANNDNSVRPARAPQSQPPRRAPRRRQRQAGAGASADVAAKVKAAALAKVTGGTIIRTETDVDHGSPYEAHVRKSDGTEVEVLVNEKFEVTAVNEMGAGGPGRPGGPDGRGAPGTAQPY